MENELLKSTLVSTLQLIRGLQLELEALQLKHEAVLAALADDRKFAAAYTAPAEDEDDDSHAFSSQIQLIDVAINSIQELPKVGYSERGES